LELARGITRHKAATFAEAEMLAQAGVKDIVLAYNLVGPNVQRAVRFRAAYAEVALAVTADAADPIRQLGAAMQQAGQSILVLLDVDTGQHRTGVPCGETARELYRLIRDTPGLKPAGIHLYDGQNHQTDLAERRAAVMECWRDVTTLREQLEKDGCPVPRIVAGCTGSFPIFAEIRDPAVELSPGTCVFHDAGFGRMFPDLPFRPAALLLTRVISRPTADRVTLDLGYKAVASDPPADRRVVLPDLPDARIVLQNEEHLVISTPEAARLRPGDELLAVPYHVCPTSALHREVFVIRQGKLAERWEVSARDRWLNV
jgi:D-serine deaminase-like pyridoxal phosphate-dependent protein